jgi:heat-inducible transcriptional repressor
MENSSISRRQNRILKHVIEEYVVSAQPVSSEVVVRKYEPKVSSATVRNDMAALQDAGLLDHPHSSAGRVPSDVGYRHYVEYLMNDVRLSQSEERTILHQFHQVEPHVSEWSRLASAVLSSYMQMPVVVVPPLEKNSRLMRLDLVPVATGKALLVVILHSGGVREQLVRLGEELSPDALPSVAARWNERVVDRSAIEIRAVPWEPSEVAIIEALVQVLEEEDQRQGWQVEGLSHIAAQPEFGSPERLQPVFEILERRGSLDDLVHAAFQAKGVLVSIGQEQPLEALRECSAILCSYGRPGQLMGAVGIIGPRRLQYWRAVPMVEYVADMLDRLLEETFLS